MQSYGTCHKQVVVLANNRAVCAVRFLLVGKVLVQTTRVALHIQILTNNLYHRGYDHRLCSHVGMEAVFSGQALQYVLFRLFPCIEVGIDPLNLIKDELRLVPIHITFLVVRFECIAFDDEQGVVVERRYLRRFPRQQVYVAMPVPLRHDSRSAPLQP